MTSPDSDIPVLAGIRRELVDGIARAARPEQPRWRPPASRGLPRWALATLVVAVVALTVIVGLNLRAPREAAPSAFAMSVLPSGRIHVKVAPDFDQAMRLQQELRDAGIKVKVIRITAHPQLVGTIEFPSHQLDPRGVERAKGEFWIDPAQFTGTVEVLIYVAPKPGEAWQQAPSVFHPDQPLGGLPCARPGPMNTATLEDFARQVGITQFRWLVTAGDPTAREVRLEQRPGRPNGDVEAAMLRSPTLLEVTVRPADLVARYGHAPQPSMNLNLHEAAEPRCTPRLAARWQ
jgi:hypothetical protein